MILIIASTDSVARWFRDELLTLFNVENALSTIEADTGVWKQASTTSMMDGYWSRNTFQSLFQVIL